MTSATSQIRRKIMNLKNKAGLIAVALFALWALAAPSNVHAIAQLRLSDGTTTVTVDDNGAGDVTNTTLGVITFAGTLGNTAITVTVDTGTTKPALGSAGAPEMDITYNLTTTGPVNLSIRLTDNKFVGPTNSFALNLDGNNNRATSTVTVGAWFDNGNTNFLQTTQLFLSGAIPGTDQDFNQSTNTATAGALYSLTMGVDISHPAGSNCAPTGSCISTGDLYLVGGKIPEPSTMLLFGAGLVGLGIWGRKRFEKK